MAPEVVRVVLPNGIDELVVHMVTSVVKFGSRLGVEVLDGVEICILM